MDDQPQTSMPGYRPPSRCSGIRVARSTNSDTSATAGAVGHEVAAPTHAEHRSRRAAQMLLHCDLFHPIVIRGKHRIHGGSLRIRVRHGREQPVPRGDSGVFCGRNGVGASHDLAVHGLRRRCVTPMHSGETAARAPKHETKRRPMAAPWLRVPAKQSPKHQDVHHYQR
jgi:hypothetical protein